MTGTGITTGYAEKKIVRDAVVALTVMVFLSFCLMVAEAGLWLDIALAVGLLLFLVQLLRLWRRYHTRLTWDQETVELQIEGKVIAVINWTDLTGFSLRYYSTRRDRSNGWFDLTLTDTTGNDMKVDSDLVDFDRFVTFAWAKARTHSVVPNSATHANLKALGLIPDQD